MSVFKELWEIQSKGRFDPSQDTALNKGTPVVFRNNPTLHLERKGWRGGVQCTINTPHCTLYTVQQVWCPMYNYFTMVFLVYCDTSYTILSHFIYNSFTMAACCGFICMYYQVDWFFFLAIKRTQGKREINGQAERGREGGRQSFFPSISLLSLPFYLSLSLFLCLSVCLFNYLSACSTISLSSLPLSPSPWNVE